MKEIPKHQEMKQFPVIDNELQIGGIPVSRLVERVGQTPFYAYDRGVINDRVEQLRNKLPDSIHIHYAIKANPMPAVVQHLAGLTDGLDVASLGELTTALDTGVDPKKISFAGPAKSNVELKAAIASGVIINIESEGELDRIIEFSDDLSLTPRVSVRINPSFELKTSGMTMSGGAKPFGIDEEIVPDIIRRINDTNLDFYGFHIFSGSQNLKPEALLEAQTKTFKLAYRISDFSSTPIKWLNIGGGFGIPYFPGDKSLDINPIAENLYSRIEECKEKLPEAEIIIELGRYLVGEAGIYICKVVDKKISRDETFILTNGGLHHHLAASGNFGQVIRKNYPVCIANKVTSNDTEIVNVVGPLCTPLDILANKVELPEVDVGDLVAIFQSGAYGMSASPRGFLSHPDAMEVLI